MTNAQEFQRHPEDNRIVVINTMEDFHLWEQRYKLGFSGLLLPNALPEEELQIISNDIINIFDSSRRPLTEKNNRHYYPGLNLEGELQNKGYNKLTVDRVVECSELLRRISFGISDDVYVRKDSEHPKRPHKHNATLGLVFSGTGTLMVKEDFQFTADEQSSLNAITSKPQPEDVYSLSAGDLIVFENIWHYAPSLKKDGTEPPRTNLVI